jgi:hypothetical protein
MTALAKTVVSEEYRTLIIAVPGAMPWTTPVGVVAAIVGWDELHCKTACESMGALVVSWINPPTLICAVEGEIWSPELPDPVLIPKTATFGCVEASQAATRAKTAMARSNDRRLIRGSLTQFVMEESVPPELRFAK